jgi:hypothetical protein
MFLRQIDAVFLVRTRPDSSMAKPAAIHITRAPVTRKEKVLNMNWVSAETSARAGPATAAKTAARPSAATILRNVIVLTVIVDPPDRTVCPNGNSLANVLSRGMASPVGHPPPLKSVPRTVPTRGGGQNVTLCQ